MSQLIHLWSLSSDDALCDLRKAAESCAVADGVLSSNGLDLDEDDARVIWATVVGSVAEVTEPCLQSWRVVLLDSFAVGDDVCLSAD